MGAFAFIVMQTLMSFAIIPFLEQLVDTVHTYGVHPTFLKTTPSGMDQEMSRFMG